MERIRRGLPLLTALSALAALVLCPAPAAHAARGGLRLCVEMLFPALFPFFVVSGLLRLTGLPGLLGRSLERVSLRLFSLSGAGTSALLFGLTGGYPLGAKAIGDLVRDGTMTAEEAERALPLCNNSGPAFLIGAAGTGVFHERRIGLLLYLTHLAAALILGLLLKPRTSAAPRERVFVRSLSLGAALPEAVRDAVNAMLTVCGFAVTCAVLSGLLEQTGVISEVSILLAQAFGTVPQFFRALATGLLELGSGVGAMQGLTAAKQNTALAAFLIGFGGVSVHCQTAAVLAGTGVRLRKHFWGRVLHGMLAAMMMLIL